MALPIERRVERLAIQQRDPLTESQAGKRRADGIPAAAAVVVGVAAVRREGRAHLGPRGPVAIRVEVQIVLQLVAGAVVEVGVARGVRRAAHVVAVVAERLAVVRGVAGSRGAVAVQIPADGVQLRQGADFDQAVVVVVVVAVLRRGVHAAVAQRRVVRALAEVPRRFVRVAVAVHVHVGPAGEDAGGRRRRLQLRRGAAGALVGRRDAARLAVPVARRGRAGVAGQAVLVGRRAAARDRAGRVAGDDGSAVAAHQPAGAAGAALRLSLRVAGHDHRTRRRRPHQAADVGVARHRAARPRRLHPAPRRPRQRRRRTLLADVHVGVRQPQRAHHGAAAQHREQPAVVAVAVDVEVVDGVAVAVEHGVEVGAVAGRPAAADGIPAAAAVVVGVARVAGAARVRRTVAVGVEVQVPGQLVAGAGGRAGDGRAAHVRAGVGEGAAGAGVVRGVAGRGTVAVQIPADRVQLRERGDLDQAVVVHVVVRAGALVVRDGHAQHRRRAAVAAAGGRVGEGDGLVDGVRFVDRHRVDRLRRAPVLRGEGERTDRREGLATDRGNGPYLVGFARAYRHRRRSGRLRR